MNCAGMKINMRRLINLLAMSAAIRRVSPSFTARETAVEIASVRAGGAFAGKPEKR